MGFESPLATNLRILRAKRGLRQIDVAEGTGATAAAICRYERGSREPSFAMAARLADFYGVTLESLRKVG